MNNIKIKGIAKKSLDYLILKQNFIEKNYMKVRITIIQIK